MNKLERLFQQAADIKQQEADARSRARKALILIGADGSKVASADIGVDRVLVQRPLFTFEEMDALCDWWRGLREETGDDW